MATQMLRIRTLLDVPAIQEEVAEPAIIVTIMNQLSWMISILKTINATMKEVKQEVEEEIKIAILLVVMASQAEYQHTVRVHIPTELM
jgi:hypothetical protein